VLVGADQHALSRRDDGAINQNVVEEGKISGLWGLPAHLDQRAFLQKLPRRIQQDLFFKKEMRSSHKKKMLK
jgi:hypothetical protein